MHAFFNESLDIVDDVYGNPVLANGDTVVMDNCGFHHGRFAEAELRRMLENRGVTLIFQPPYSPEFNTIQLSTHESFHEKTRTFFGKFYRNGDTTRTRRSHTRNLSKILRTLWISSLNFFAKR